MTNPIIIKMNHKVWKNEKGQFHRIDGPAIEYLDGSKYWCINGKYHRLDGPAVEYSDGSKGWCIEGRFLNSTKVRDWYQEMNLDTNIPLTTDEQMLFKLKFS